MAALLHGYYIRAHAGSPVTPGLSNLLREDARNKGKGHPALAF
jgi:hypothetical protein